MLHYFAIVSAVYIYHRHTKQFLGITKSPDNRNDVVTPVESVDEALDFKIREGGVKNNEDYNPSNIVAIVDQPSSNFISIVHPVLNKSFDASSGIDRNGNELILYNSHNNSAQIFKLVMRADFSMILMWKERCMKYNTTSNTFFTGACTNLNQSSFDLYMETLPAKKIIQKELVKIKEITDPEFKTDDVIDYKTGNKVNMEEKPQTAKNIIISGNIMTQEFDDTQKNDIEIKHNIINRHSLEMLKNPGTCDDESVSSDTSSTTEDSQFLHSNDRKHKNHQYHRHRIIRKHVEHDRHDHKRFI